jgi:hypothetical protein
VSTIWTPGGEHRPRSEPVPSGPEASRPPGAARGDGADRADLTDEELEAELATAREQLRRTPVADIVANHAIGLWQLAILHLGDATEGGPNLREAQLAIDAMAAIVEGLAGSLGENEQPLRDALANVRMAFVEATSA